MAQEYIAQVEIGDAVIDVRFVSQQEREAISDAAQERLGGIERTNRAKLSNGLADAMIRGWKGITPLDALGWGYADFENLPTDDAGQVPYSPEIARQLFRRCQYDKFAQTIEAAARDMMEAIAREKKAALRRSAA